MTPPVRLWVIVDLDPESEFVMGEYRTRSEAREHCRRLNSIRGYDPTCRVVEYRLATQAPSPAVGNASKGDE